MTELTYLEAVVLGLVQGLTEFLPVSSSGHLAIAQKLFDLPGSSPQMLLFDVLSHTGTLLAVAFVFAGTFKAFAARLIAETRPSFGGKRTGWLVALLGVVACVPTAAIGLGFKDKFEASFDSMPTVGIGLLISGALLFAVGRVPRPRRGWRRIGWWRAVMVGIAQGAAILPGLSRSGSTICTAMMLGFKRRWAAEFSFLIVVPPIVGATLIKLRDTFALPPEQLGDIAWWPLILGSIVALISGVVALRLLLALVIRQKLQHFCWYCWLLGGVVLVAWLKGEG